MSMTTTHPPTDIIRALLISKGVGNLPLSSDPSIVWPIYATTMPDMPDNLIFLKDTKGPDDGADMVTNETALHPGIQVVVRHKVYRSGWTKCKEIIEAFQSVNMDAIQYGTPSALYLINGIYVFGNIIPLGKEMSKSRPTEEDARQRELFSINAITTIREIIQ